MVKMYKNEGLGAYWKGIVPPIIVETPKRAVKVVFRHIANFLDARAKEVCINCVYFAFQVLYL